MAEAAFHSSGKLTIDLTGAIRRMAGDGSCANLSEAVASLTLGMLIWGPTSLHVDGGLTITALGLRKPADLPRILTENLLDMSIDPLPLRHQCLGLRWLLRWAGRATFHTSETHMALGQTFQAAWPIPPPRPRDAGKLTPLRAQWRLPPAPELDLACLRRRLLKCPVPVFINGQPLLYCRTEPCTPEYLWESHDLHLPAADPALAAATLGTAARDLGRDLGQPIRLRRGHTLILGREFEGEGLPLYSVQKPPAESDSFFRSGPANWANIPLASSTCALQLRPRHATRIFPVAGGFCLDPLDVQQWEPGWRIWVPADHEMLSADLRTPLRNPRLLARARQALDRARERLEIARPVLAKVRL